MKRFKLISLIFVGLLLLACPSTAKGQSSNLIMGSTILPQGNQYNPAYFPVASKVYLTLPSLNFQFGLPVSYSDVLQYDAAQGQSTININNIVDKLMENKLLDLGLDMDVLGFGFRVKNLHFDASARLRVDGDVTVPNGLLTLLTEGNANYTGTDHMLNLLDGQIVNLAVFAEFGLGGAYQVSLPGNDLTVGAKIKLLDGLASATNTNTYANLYTAEDFSSMRADIFYQLNASAPLDIESKSLTTMFPKNFGMAFDLGARLENKWIDASLSLTDIGGTIKWSDGLQTITPQQGATSVTFEGIDIAGAFNGEGMDTAVLNTIIDTLKGLADYQVTKGGDAYTTTLPTKLNASCFYKAFPILRVGAVFHGEFGACKNSLNPVMPSQKSMRSNTSILLNLNLWNWAELIAGNSIVNDGVSTTWLNPSVGFNLSIANTFQAYFMFDYASSIYLVDVKSFKSSLGLSFTFGKVKNKKAPIPQNAIEPEN